MSNPFLVYLENASGAPVGGGPLFTGIKWTYKQKLSQAGEWSLALPLADPRLPFAALKRRAHCYIRRAGREIWLGSGIIESRNYGLSGDDVPVMTLSGPDLLRELTGVTVKFEVSALAAAPRTSNILRQIFAAVPDWTATLPTPSNIPALAFVFTGESNAGGRGLNSAATAAEVAPRAAVQIMNLTSGSFGFENLDIGTNNLRDHAGLEAYYANSHGLENGLANAVEYGAFPQNPSVYLIKTGQGGSTIGQWGTGGAYWTKFLQRITAAKAQLPTLRQWVVWYSLGINDGIAGTNIAAFKADTIAHLQKIKAELPGAIIIMTQFQSMTAGYAAINSALSEVAAITPGVYVVSASGATISDPNHWDYAGLITMAQRMVTTTLANLPTLTLSLPEITARFVDESVLSALVAVCKKTGAFFWMAPYSTAPRQIVVATAPVNSGIVATNLVDPLTAERNAKVCLLSDIEYTETSWDARNRLIVYGAGDGAARLSLATATAWPDGGPIASPFFYTDPAGRDHVFVLDKATNTITDTLAAAEYGPDEIAVAYKDISPVTNNDADMIAAANTLVSAAVNQLVLSSLPAVGFRLSVAALRAVVHPGMQIRVIAQKYRNGVKYIDIDENLFIQEVDCEVDATGEKVTGLTVATTWQPQKTDATILTESIQKLTSLEAHPQLGPTDPVICYSADIDDVFGAEFPFWVSNNTSAVNSVTVRFTLSKFRSTVKTIGGTATAQLDIPDHHHESTVASHQHSVNLPSHAHSIPLAGDAASHGLARVVYFNPPDSGLYYDAAGGPAASVTSNSGGGATVTSSGGGGQTVTSDDGGGQTGLNVDISNALTAVYGIYEDPLAAYGVADLAWEVNGALVTSTPNSIGFGWYEMDITSLLVNPLTLRPLRAANSVVVAVGNKVGRNVRVNVQIEIRKTVQAITVFADSGAAVAAARGAAASSILSSPPSASPLNADTLDGLDSTDFVRVNDAVLVKTRVNYGQTFAIADGYQYIVAFKFTVNGTLECAGELVVI